MRDPLDQLKHLSLDGTGPALSASEVRRRGDHLRRRRTALQATGVAAAVALIAGGGAMISGTLTSTTPPAGPATPTPSSPAPSPEDAGAIPAGFPLDAGIEAAPGMDSTDLAVDDAIDQPWWALPCQAEPRGRDDARSRTAARRVWVQGDSWSKSRQLVVYRDQETAARAFTGLEEVVAACAETDEVPPGAEPLTWEPDPAGLDGAKETVVAWGSNTTDASHTNHVGLWATRVGRAVVVSRHNQPGPIAAAQSLESSHLTVVESMCVWSSSGCSASSPGPQQPDQSSAREPEPDGGWRTEIPAGLVDALWASLPQSGGDVPAADEDSSLDLPWRGLPCGSRGDGEYPDPLTSTWLPGVDDRRTDQRFVSVSPPAEFQARQLAVYEDGDSAAEAVAAIARQAEECGPEPDPDLPTELRWAVDTWEVTGTEALLLSGGTFVEGTDDRTIGRTLVTVVRRGNAVLTAQLSDESSAPLDARDDRDARALLEATTGLAERMCVFSSDECAT